ncbi:hypothetical protein [Rossellomorea sp. NRS-1567]|uniref:hypothetical protein n=1 Tax=Rossellomorea sp. NRS-1567 TaxID=3233901 RepID=UPI003D2995CF
MQFIKPKNNNAYKVDWQTSEQVREIVQKFAVYCEYRKSEVVDMFLKNLLKGEEFLKWVDGIRNNKKMIRKMGLEDVMEGQKLD